jgi:hypothetical protein
MPVDELTPTAPGLERAPEGQRQLDAILHVELAVLHFPFRQINPNITRLLARAAEDRAERPAYCRKSSSASVFVCVGSA